MDAPWTSPRLPRLSSALLFFIVACSVQAATPASAPDADTSRISVTAVAGDVDATMAGQPANLAPEATLLLPARIVTGHDGNVGLTQAGTKISVASDTDVEIPAEAVDGNLIARLVQHSGNVFYDVAPRDLGKLRVETPFLVAVIKGTQFNVAVQDGSTTISLFEGSLEIHTPDDDDVIQLNAGEIAIRSLIDDAIRVVGMNDERVAVPPPAQRAPSEVAAASPEQAEIDGTKPVVLANDDVAVNANPADVTAKPTLESSGSALDGGELIATLVPRFDVRGNADVRLEKSPEVPSGLELGLDTGIEVRGDRVDLALDTGIDVTGTGGVALDAYVDLGGRVGGIGLGASTDLGGPVELDTDVDLGAGVDASADGGLDLGGPLDAGGDAGLDLSVIDAPADAGVDLDIEVSSNPGLNLGEALDVGLDVDLNVDLDVGLDDGHGHGSGRGNGRGNGHGKDHGNGHGHDDEPRRGRH